MVNNITSNITKQISNKASNNVCGSRNSKQHGNDVKRSSK